MNTGIYAIENILTGAAYVGGTRRGFLSRWLQHRGSLLLGHHNNAALQEDWSRHGSGWFKFVVLERIDAADMTAAHEQRWIHELKGQGRLCYNRVPVFTYPLFKPHSPTRPMTAQEVAHALGLPNPVIPGLPDDEPVLTVEQLANYFSVNKLTVLRLLSTGTLVGFRAGRAWRITKHAVAMFLHRNPQSVSTQTRGTPR